MRSKKLPIVVTGTFLSLVAVVVAFRKSSAVASQDLSSAKSSAPAEVAAVDPSGAPESPAAAPAVSTGALFTYTNKPANAARVESLMVTPSHEVHYAQIDKTLVGGKNSPIAKQGSRVEIALPDGSVLPVVIARTQVLGEGRYVSEGTIGAQDEGRAVFAYNNGELSAKLDDINHGSWQIRSIGGSTSQVFKVDAALVPGCEADTKQLSVLKAKAAASRPIGADVWDTPEGQASGYWYTHANGWTEWIFGPKPATTTPATTTQTSGPTDGGAGRWYTHPNGWTEWIADTVSNVVNTWQPTPETPVVTPPTNAPVVTQPEPAAPTPQVSWGNTQIRILVPYSRAIENAMSASAVRSQIDLAIASLNNDFSRSGIPVTAVLAGASAIQYNQEFDSSGGAVITALSRLQSSSDGILDEVHIMRGETNADLVCFAMAQNDPSNSGVGYILNSAGDPTNSLWGFSVLNFWYLNSNSTFSHEIGHNLGCNHDRDNARSTDSQAATGIYSYSYGYRFYGRDGQQYRTIMAYAPGNVLPYFSNPNIWAWAPISAPVGVQPGSPGEAYNALSITQNAAEVGSFHLSRLVTRTLSRLRGW